MDSHPLLPRKALASLYVTAAALVAVLSLAVFARAADAAVGSSTSYLVTFAAGASESDQAAAIAGAGGTDISEVAPLRMHTVSLPDQTAVDSLKANANVASLDVDKTRDITAVPSDPGYA